MGKNINHIHSLFFVLVLSVICATAVSAQKFSVTSFKLLSNDVSGFINPVRDLNDEDCGLLKVIAPEDFVFSTPLGIVRREDHAGEIWLYLPRGSKKITIKHAELGVLRDYVFPIRIDSHMSYEMIIDVPRKPERMVAPAPVILLSRDTLRLTRTDTIVVLPVKQRLPLVFNAMATLSFGGSSNSAMSGVLLMALKRNGGFVHVASDFGKSPACVGECDRTGLVAGAKPYYSGHTARKSLMLCGGAVHRVNGRFAVYEGLGYGDIVVSWQLAPSEGGGYLKNSYYSRRGLAAEAGAVVNIGKISVSASVMTLKGSDWFASVGVGINFGNRF